MTYGDSLSSLSLASELSGGISLYSLAHGSGGHVRVNRLNPRAPIYCVYGACAVCRCVQVQIMAAYSKRGAILRGTRDVVSKLFITSRVPIKNKEFGSRYDETMMK